ncbi:uncharacterized protein LOC144880974 [Branchiostoma floridae x Branchiostoma japonicum]
MAGKRLERMRKAAQPTADQDRQTENYLTFEKALERAQKEGKLPAWQGAEGGQQVFLDKLKMGGKTATKAKAEFNRMCKENAGGSAKKRGGADLANGNTGRQQAIHPPEVAIPVAIEVYKKFLEKEGDVSELRQSRRLRQRATSDLSEFFSSANQQGGANANQDPAEN